MSRLSRAGFLSAAAGAALYPHVEWTRTAIAQGAPAKLSDIEHIVVLLQENRSFDHYFGTLSGVRGFDDPRVVLLPAGQPAFFQPDPGSAAKFVLPFRLDTQRTSAMRLHDLNHNWGPLHASWNEGRMNGWICAQRATERDAAPLTMGYYTRDDIPFHYALADTFTICDGYHASLMGPTNPNRYYWMSATIDPDGKNGGPATNNSGKRYTWETYPEALDRAGVTWRIYRPEITAEFPVGLDVIMNFAAFQDAAPNSNLYQNAAKQRSVDAMLHDIRMGDIPQVTWIVPPFDVCEHPDMLPADGENYIRRILSAFWANPALWAKTAFIVSYDENDGLFDHVVPPTPPPGTLGEFIGGSPIGLGFRVPCMLISPFSRGGYVCSDTFDHTSILQFIEKRFGVEVPHLTNWRRQACGDLTAAFGFGEPADTSTPNLPETAQALTIVKQLLSTPGLPLPSVPGVQMMPHQEPAGTFTRRRRGSG